MRRIVLMVLRLFYIAPYYVYRIWKFGRDDNSSYDEAFAYIKKVTNRANHAGRVISESHGEEHVPK